MPHLPASIRLGRLGGYHFLDFVRALFSWSYELLFPQLLYIHNHPNCPGVYPQFLMLAAFDGTVS
jgi:hypothetical protein